MLYALWAGCAQDYSVLRQTRSDVFVQERLHAIDVLLVVDNSGSMQDEQDHLAQSFSAFIDALEVGNTDWRVAVTTSEPSLEAYRAVLEGATDELVVETADGAPLDSVAWDDRTWDLRPGVAWSRCGDGWQAAAPTPGAPNPCASTSSGPDGGLRSPAAGDLVISELLPRPLTPGCGWAELWNTTGFALDLGGVVVRDDGRDRLTLPPGLRLPADGTLVLGGSEGCAPAPDLVDPGFHLASGARWVDRDTPDPGGAFSELVAVGTGAFGLEMGFENALLTLTDPAQPVTDGAFLRDEANLALVFLSDEDDISPDPVADYVNAFRALKGTAGARDPDRVRFAVAAGVDPPEASGGPSCANDRGEAEYAPRYVELADLTGGHAWSICGDLSLVAESFGLTFSEQRHEFQLSDVPAIDTLEVTLFASLDATDPESRPELGVDFTVEARDAGHGQQEVWLVFPPDVLPPESVVVAQYAVVADSVRLTGSTP